MFNNPYAAEMLAAQHGRELRAEADQARLAHKAASAQAGRHQRPAHRGQRRWLLWAALRPHHQTSSS